MPLGAYGDSRDDGDLVPPSLAMTMDGSFTLGSPSSDYVGNQQEPRFIGKDDMGAQPSSVFLCAATLFVSTVRFCLHRVPKLASLAFAESILSHASSARYGQDGTARQTRVRPSRQCAPWSTDWCGNPAPSVPSAKDEPDVFSAMQQASMGAREKTALATLRLRPVVVHHASASLNSDCIRSVVLLHSEITHHPAKPKRVYAGLPEDRRFP